MLPLSPSQRRYLRAQAHHLSPVVMIGDAGLSPAVLKETASALKAHELIKIKVMNDERTEREAMLKSICDTLKAAPVQHVGKMLVVYKAAATPVIKLPR
ncbi:MAG: YhbY family RNA-binding protein [Burkholderiales bacterium]|nr:YhbY family RNA-binding protein [Burkholderiales bacterium]